MLHIHKVLIVDDEENVRKALKRCIRKIPGVSVYTAGDAEMGQKVMSAEEIEIVISDQKMPGIQGADFLSWVRQNYPSVISIMLTGYADLDTAMKTINEGKVFKFLTKPWENEGVVETVKKAIDVFHRYKKALELYETQNQKYVEIMEELENQYPGITFVKRDSAGRIIIEEEDELNKTK